MKPVDGITVFPEFFKKYTEQIGPSTPLSRATAKEKKEKILQIVDSSSFFLSLKLDFPPRITWTHNTKAVLGCRTLDYLNFIERIHPDYQGIYFQFGVASYQLAQNYKEQITQIAAQNKILVPLCDDQGDYYWFSQKAELSEFDKDKNLSAHINTYTRIAPYENALILSKPMVHFDFQRKTDIEEELGQISGEAVVSLLFSQHMEDYLPLKDTHHRILIAWWDIYGKINNLTTHKLIAEQISMDNFRINKRGIKVSTIKKYVQAILQAANQVFPFYPIKDMNELCGLLVRLFGKRG